MLCLTTCLLTAGRHSLTTEASTSSVASTSAALFNTGSVQASPMRATDAVAAADDVEMSAMLGQLLSQAGNPESKSAVQVSRLTVPQCITQGIQVSVWF